MLPLGNLERPARFPWVTIGLILASVLVWLAYEVRVGVDEAAGSLGFRPCEIDDSCLELGRPWLIDTLTAMFTHGGWSHLVGNLVFLAALGPLVEGLLGHVRYLVLYLVAASAPTFCRAGSRSRSTQARRRSPTSARAVRSPASSPPSSSRGPSLACSPGWFRASSSASPLSRCSASGS